MGVIQLDPKWNGLIDEDLIERIDDTPFLRRCRERSVTREELRDFTVQQQFYSKHFTRYLCALLSNIEHEGDRLELTENLLEEIGFGSDDQVPHSKIYRDMMERMGVSAASHSPNPATLRLIEAMFECCRNPNPMVGLGALCLGAEAIVPHVYSQVVEGFRGQNETDANLDFFHIHINDDDAHAVTMLKIIDRELQQAPAQRAVVKNAARRVLEARCDFFNAVSPEENVPRLRQVCGGIFYEQLHV